MTKFILLSLCLYLLLSPFCLKQTDGFTLTGIQTTRSHHPEWETRALTAQEEVEFQEAVAQKFTYFGCGGQCFVFFSEDQKYALKFFKQSLYELPLWLKYIHLPWPFSRYQAKKAWKRQDKLSRDFGSYKLSFDELKEESQLIYVHLNKTTHLHKEITLIDRLGITHKLALDEYDFVLQKKADLIYPKIDTLMHVGNLEKSRETITHVLRLIHTRCTRGFSDRDPNIRTNCGLVEDLAIKIDVGKIGRDDTMKVPAIYKNELLRISQPFKIWIDQNHPQLSEHFEKELNKLMEEEA